MRRALFAFVGTALGTGLMVGAKLGTRPPGLGVDLTQSETVAGAEPAAPTHSPPAPFPSATAGTPTAAGPAGPTGAPPTSTQALAPTTAPPPPPAGGGLKNGTFAGPSVTQRYGTIKVSIVVSGGRITDATATYPTGGDTGEINARAIPRLRQSALSAQSANIATVSGATYTSNAYKQSLQGAINAAKA